MPHYFLSLVLLCLTSNAVRIPAVLEEPALKEPRARSKRAVTVRKDDLPPAVAAGGETYRIDPSGGATTQNRVGTYLYGFDGCADDQKGWINEAYYDAWTMSSLDGVKANIDWNEAAALEFLGPPGLNQPQQAQIQAVLANMATVIYSYKNPFFRHALHVRCDDPKKKCQNRPENDPCQPNPPNPGQKAEKLPNAYSANEDPDDGYSMINFCEGFMNLRSLTNGYAYGSGLSAPIKYRIDRYNNRATTFFHELLHLDLAADSANNRPNPQTDDLTIRIKLGSDDYENTVAYGGSFTKVLARTTTDPGYYVQRNAENLAFFALAKYVMSKNGNVYPHLPVIHLRIDGPPWIEVPRNNHVVVFGNNSQGLYLNTNATDMSTLKVELPDIGDYPGCVDRTDQGSGTVLAINDLVPITAYPPEYVSQQKTWLQELGYSATQPSTDAPPNTNACHGISGDYWVMSRDTAVDNAKDFCAQTDKTKTYNIGSVNELELSVKKLDDDSKGPKDAPDCLGQFQNAVIDGCDGADPVNNPHNYKFGSTLTADGWEFKMTPLSKQVNEVNCDVSYKFWYNQVEIRGKNLPDAKLGANGEGLRKEIDGCGALTKWNFERTPDDCCFQWYAMAYLNIGTKDCVGRAVESAGGSGKGNCHGPGKRQVNGTDAIDNWPGYGDSSKHVFKTKAQVLEPPTGGSW